MVERRSTKVPDFSDTDRRTMDDKLRSDPHYSADVDIALGGLAAGPKAMLRPRPQGSSRFRVRLWQTQHSKSVPDLLKKHKRRDDEVPPPKLG